MEKEVAEVPWAPGLTVESCDCLIVPEVGNRSQTDPFPRAPSIPTGTGEGGRTGPPWISGNHKSRAGVCEWGLLTAPGLPAHNRHAWSSFPGGAEQGKVWEVQWRPGGKMVVVWVLRQLSSFLSREDSRHTASREKQTLPACLPHCPLAQRLE